MKKRNLFITLGLALGLGVAGVAGLAHGKEALEAKADASAYNFTRIYCDVEGNNFKSSFHGDSYVAFGYWWGGSGTPTPSAWPGNNISANTIKYNGRDVYYADINANATGYSFLRGLSAQTYDGSNRWGADGNTLLSDGINFLQPYNWGDSGNYYSARAYKVTLHVDSQSSDELYVRWSSSDKYTPADPAAKQGYTFVGWYENLSDANTKYTSRELTEDLELYAKYATNTYAITKEVYYDDAKQSSTEENVEEGSNYNVVDPNNVAGYHFKGWYYRSNEQWGSEVPATIVNVTEPITICARYESAAKIGKDSYIYYVTDVTSGEQTPDYIYSYNKALDEASEKQFGAWPGTAITTAGTDVHGVLAFQGGPGYGKTRLIYRIPYCTEFTDDQIILVYNNGKDAGGSQTASMLLVSHSAYWWSDDSEYHNDEAGAALDYILNFESKRNAVEASGDIKSTSICGISETDAAKLVSDYNAIDATTRATYIDTTYAYTYRMGGYYSDLDNVSFRSMLEELAALWELNLNATSNVGRIVSAVGGNTTLTSNTLVIILITSAVVITLGGVFLLRRKEN